MDQREFADTKKCLMNGRITAIHIRQQHTAAPWLAFLSIMLVAFSATAQTRRYPTNPANRGGGIAGTQARSLSVPRIPDADQAKYIFLNIDPQGVGHCYIDAHAFNYFRQLVVDWSDPNDPTCNALHASLWGHGTWTSLDFVDQNYPDMSTYLTSLNEWGIAFGVYWSNSYPYLPQPAAGINVRTGRWSVLPDTEDLPYNQGFSMNNNGLVVGVATDLDNSVFKHWIWDGRKYHFPAFPADWDVSTNWAGPLFINDFGQIAGQYVDRKSGRMRGYFQDGWYGGKVTTFDAPGHPSGGTYVNRMTNSGNLLLIGLYDETSPYYPAHSFSWRRGVFTSLPNVPFRDAVLTHVFGLNDQGDICGVWWDNNNLGHAFVGYRK